MFPKKISTSILILAIIFGQASYVKPVKALGTPRIVSVSPGSPSPVGSRVCIRAEVTWDSDFRSMRIKFGNEGWNESAEINFERCFDTGHLGAGWYKIRVEVAKVNEGWESATSTEQDYELTPQNNEPPPPNNPQVSCSVNSFEVWPNPAKTGETIHIIGSGRCNTQVRATKVKINGNDYYEIGGATTLDTTWNTSSAGNYNLTLLVAGEGDNGWQNAASQNITLQVYTPNESQEDESSNNPNDVFQHRDVINIGGDIFVIIREGSAIQRRHVPNPETLDALGISRSWVNNRGFTDNQLRSIGQGSDIPDVIRDPDGFQTFKNTYFSDTQPINPQEDNKPQNNVEVQPGQFDPHAKGVCDGWETRLWVGGFARVTNQGDQLKLRTGPSLQDTVIDKLPSGYKFMVIGGPICVDTYTWWNIQGEGGAGWAAEAGDRWWIAPMTEPPVQPNEPESAPILPVPPEIAPSTVPESNESDSSTKPSGSNDKGSRVCYDGSRLEMKFQDDEWHHYVEFDTGSDTNKYNWKIVSSPIPSSPWGADGERYQIGFRWISNWNVILFQPNWWTICSKSDMQYFLENLNFLD